MHFDQRLDQQAGNPSPGKIDSESEPNRSGTSDQDGDFCHAAKTITP